MYKYLCLLQVKVTLSALTLFDKQVLALYDWIYIDNEMKLFMSILKNNLSVECFFGYRQSFYTSGRADKLNTVW